VSGSTALEGSFASEFAVDSSDVLDVLSIERETTDE
jgi:hypothetical protein